MVGMLSVPSFATVYSGNGATGFDGAVGNGSLSLTDSGGMLNVAFTPGAGDAFNDGLVIYIDSSPGAPDLNPGDTPGYYNSNATLQDNGGFGAQTEATATYAANPNDSNANTKVGLTFPTGFYADYALVIANNGMNVFELPSQNTPAGNGSLIIVGSFISNATSPYGGTIPLSEIGVTPGNSFDLLGNYIANSAYGSNETIGTSVTVPSGTSSPNAGFNGSVTWSTFGVYTTTVPEPASMGLVGGVSMLLVARRRKA
jgi:hypothetical protein